MESSTLLARYDEQLRADAEVDDADEVVQRDGETVAIVWCLWFAGVFAFYQTGWDDAHRELSPGVILVDEAIQVARRLGATTFDFLRGPEDYKYRWRPDEVVAKRGLAVVSDEGALSAAVDRAIEANPDVADKIRDGKVAAAGALIGAVMKEMRGQADAGRVRELILAKLT